MKFPIIIEIDDIEYTIDKTDYKDFLDIYYKDDFNTYKMEMKDEWRDEKENEGDVLPFAEWFETIYEYELNFESWLEKEYTEEEIMNELKEYVEEYKDEWEDD